MSFFKSVNRRTTPHPYLVATPTMQVVVSEKVIPLSCDVSIALPATVTVGKHEAHVRDVLVFDVETKKLAKEVEGGWENPEAMGFACAVVYSYARDCYHFFLGEESLPCLKSALLKKDIMVVSYNGVLFDTRVVFGNSRKFWIEDGAPVVEGVLHLDLYLEVLRSALRVDLEDALGAAPDMHTTFGLSKVAGATLGLEKLGKGEDAPRLYAAGQFVDLLEYNLQDVRITKMLYEQAAVFRFLKVQVV